MSITNSRYDFMKDGITADEVSGSFYPDPLTLNYADFSMTSVPLKDTLSAKKITFFWKESDNLYGSPCWDDIVLTLNGVPHKNFLQVGDVVYFPSEEDIKRSFNKERE